MKITVLNDDGVEMSYEGIHAENMMFYSAIGSQIFNTLPIMCVLKSPSFHEYIEECRTSNSFSDMFLRAVADDNPHFWNELVDAHYGGREGLVKLAKELSGKLRSLHGISEAHG